MTYETILLTHDGSETADAALPHAEEVARLSGARLIVLQAIDTVADVLLSTGLAGAGGYAGGYQTAMTGELAEQSVQAQQADAERVTTQLAERLRSAGVVRVDTLVIQGSAGSAIVEAAEQQGCDLIVMATHGRSGLSRTLLGSVADRVARNASCPVMLCRPADDDEDESSRNLRRPVLVLRPVGGLADQFPTPASSSLKDAKDGHICQPAISRAGGWK